MTQEQAQLFDYFKSISFDGGEALMTSTSPQFKAFWWLANTLTEGVSASLDIKSLVERYAFATVYYSTNGTDWNRQRQWINPHLSICDWNPDAIVDFPEAECYSSGAVILGETANNLHGPLVAEIGHLEKLNLLVMPHNRLIGSIPSEVFINCKILRQLDVSWNQLTGKIPSELGLLKFLDKIVLSNNQLTSTIPSEIGQLGGILGTLDVSGNSGLGGQIPTEFGNLSNLKVFGT